MSDQSPPQPPVSKPLGKSPQAGPKLTWIGSGTMLAAMPLSGFLLGYWTDGWLDTNPAFMLLFGALGLVGGIFKVHKLLT